MIQAFAFVDIEHPVVAWGAYRGVLISANAEYAPPECPISIMFAGLIQNNIRLHNELLIEKYRQLHFPQCNSRLTGMYFFEDRCLAERAYEWGGHFCSEYLAEVELFPTVPVFRHDANWITCASLDKQGKIENEEWIRQYWSGKPFPEKEPVWELIFQGRAVICGTELRNRAYKNISSRFPKAVSLLEISRLAALVGSDLGSSSAWLVRKENDSFDLSFYTDMRDAKNPDFLEKLRIYMNSGEPCNYADIAVGGEYFSVPDFREFTYQFSALGNISDNFLFSVHR
jgi:hypothetical protein